MTDVSRLAVVWRVAGTWYVSIVLVAAAGALIGYLVFFNVYPGRPKIGIIDIPSTVLDENTSFVIGEFLDYARRTDSIKGVVIKLDSRGSVGTAGEKMFLAIRALREEKPVVVAIGDIAASGGYMMSLPANYTFARPSSFVGSVGVFIFFPFPSLPAVPDESVIRTGSQKFLGGSKRDFLMLLDQLKEAFYQMVATERGDKLRISREDLLDAAIYTGAEAVKLGLVDEIGGDTDAISKVAELAHISHYDLVEINDEVFRIFNQRFKRITEPLSAGDGAQPSLIGIRDAVGSSTAAGDPAPLARSLASLDALRRPFLPTGLDQLREDAPPGFPLETNPPMIYYLYVGPAQ